MDNDGEPDGPESDTESATEADDDIDDVQEDGEDQVEDTEADGDEADGDMDNDGEPDGPESDTETDTEDGGTIDDVQENGETQAEDTANEVDATEADGDMDDDGEPDDADYDEDPGELEDYSDEDSDNHGDETTDDSESEHDKKEEEQAVEENQETADRTENESENADAENADKNVDDAAESKNRNPAENGIEQQTESADENSTNQVDTENDASHTGENNNGEAQTDTRDQTKEQSYDTNAKIDNKADTSEGEDAYRTAMNNMTEYMSEHNYGPDDYSEYSQDPEWQKLNADLQQSLGMEVATDVSTPSPESGKDVSATEFPDNCVMVNASDIDMTYARGMDSDQFWNHHSNTKEDYMRMAERIPDVQQALDSGKSLDEIKQNPELKDTAHAYFDPENMIKVEQQANGSYSFADDGRHRIAAAQELGYEIPVEVTNKSEGFSTESNFEPNNSKEHIDGMAYTQGNNELGYEGTCGPTSVANSLNRVMDTNKFTENDMVKTAADNKLCYTTGLPENCGGTSTGNIVDLVDKVTTPEDNITTEVYEYGNALSVDELADKLKDSNTVAMVGVDSSTLWDTRGDVTNSSLFGGVDSDYSDHWIMVDKPVYGDDGKLEGFSIVDSGGGESFVDRDKFEAMYIGNDNFQVKDPTSIIINRGESISGGVDTNIQPQEAPAQKESTFIAEETDLSPPETGDANKNADRTDVDTEIPTKDISDMPENVQHSYEQYESAGWPNVPKLPEQTLGTHASGTWQNRNGDLPRTTSDGTPITYREHDVNNKNPGSTRDAQRFVTGSDGSVYYTDDHYSTFTKLKQ